MSGMINFKEHRYFSILYGTLYAAFLWPLIFFQKTFIFGDYWQQHYPWAFEYARNLKEGSLPYWVPGMASGFPLVAEGQIGAYYPPHLLFYGLFPFAFAYTFLILAHVLIGGIGFYRYAEKIGLSREAASICAVLFSFSSAYGGCFSNTASLKVLAWLPWIMFLAEQLKGAKAKARFPLVSVIGVLFALMWTAGAPQIALYAAGYLFCYWLLRFRLSGLLNFFATSIIGVLLSLPQWLATLDLVPVSVRSGESSKFAMFGSFFPPAITSLMYPNWGVSLGSSIYIGAVSLMLILIWVISGEKKSAAYVHLALSILFLFLAFGRYTPVYSFLAEKFSFGLVRYSYKFIFFSTVSLALLTGFGFDRLIDARDAQVSYRYKRWVVALLLFVIVVPALSLFAMKSLKGPIMEFGNRQAVAAFEGKKEPPHPKSHYTQEVAKIYDRMLPVLIYSDPWNVASILFFFFSGLLLWCCLRTDSPPLVRKILLPGILVVDLFVFGSFLGTGFTGSSVPGFGNPGNARSLPAKLPLSLIETLRSGQADNASSFVEIAKDPAVELLPPNSNLFYSLSQAGGYSPLLIKRYYDLSKDLGIADSSLGRKPYSDEVWKSQRGVLESLGVSQILSSDKLSLPGIKLEDMTRQVEFDHGRKHVDTRYIYDLARVLPRVYTIYAWRQIPDSDQRLSYLKSASYSPFEEAVIDKVPGDFKPSTEYVLSAAEVGPSSRLEVNADVSALADALIVFRSVIYPRWKVEVDGKLQPLVAVNHAFCGVFTGKGNHHVRFYYDNASQKTAESAALVCWILLLTGNLLLWKRGR